ncbi:hypothetical protein [Elizabethkingia meningoseptica]|uniref:hypothetical protein n=1 Tax=Elizabethkingia meningoseptica TaxID=238 RepID=UPI002012596D|nr:hypothetical protein [Elizabethkingia meningoseptica]MCL1675868.1 hypothetical protein [Elizabethkingia meningoseptica]MCL1686487.1 hypothetical protein [Elizabethkingia meningoseptica]
MKLYLWDNKVTDYKSATSGKLSDTTLNIYDIRNKNKVDDNYEWVMGANGVIANGKTAFDEKTGDLNVYIGTAHAKSKDVDDIVETTTHELTKHGIRHKRYLNLLKTNKKEQLDKEQRANGGEDGNDHYQSTNPEGAKIYNNIMKELGLTPEWKKEQKPR